MPEIAVHKHKIDLTRCLQSRREVIQGTVGHAIISGPCSVAVLGSQDVNDRGGGVPSIRCTMPE